MRRQGQVERQHILQHHGRQPGHQGAEQQSHCDAPRGQYQYLQHVDLKYGAVGPAHTLEHGDGVELGVQVGFYGVAHAHAAHQQRSKTDKGQKQRQAVDHALQGRRSVSVIPHPPSRFRKGRSDLRTGLGDL